MHENAELEPTALDSVMAALANPLRRSLLARLTAGPVTAGDLARGSQVSMPAISRHLRILEEARLIVRSKRGRHHFIELQPEPLALATTWLARFGTAVRDADPSAAPVIPPVDDSILPLSKADDGEPSADRASQAPDLSPDSLSDLVRQLRGR